MAMRKRIHGQRERQLFLEAAVLRVVPPVFQGFCAMSFSLRLAILSCLLLIGSTRAKLTTTGTDCTNITFTWVSHRQADAHFSEFGRDILFSVALLLVQSYNSLDHSCIVAAFLLGACDDDSQFMHPSLYDLIVFQHPPTPTHQLFRFQSGRGRQDLRFRDSVDSKLGILATTSNFNCSAITYGGYSAARTINQLLLL